MGSTHIQQGQSVALNILVGLLLVFSGAFFGAWPEKTLAMVLENQTFEGGELEKISTHLNHAIELAQELGYL